MDKYAIHVLPMSYDCDCIKFGRSFPLLCGISRTGGVEINRGRCLSDRSRKKVIQGGAISRRGSPFIGWTARRYQAIGCEG